MAYNNGFDTQPHIVAELGPGDSIGIGLASLISGSNKYYALDIVKHANVERNLKIFEELLELFQSQEDIPDESEFPRVKPYLDSYEFPANILTGERLGKALNPKRIEAIRKSILMSQDEISGEIEISYLVPWNDEKILKDNIIDMIFSTAVLEHVDDLETAYRALSRCLKPSGFMAHQMGLHSHGITKEWNGHWKCSDFMWRLIRGRRAYLINRQPYSVHINLMKKCGFQIVYEKKIKQASGIRKEQVAERFKNVSDEDMTTSGVFLQAVKA